MAVLLLSPSLVCLLAFKKEEEGNDLLCCVAA
jgi:hypothetical protein